MIELKAAIDPVAQLMTWLAEETALKGKADPTAMSLATLGLDAYPRCRVVLFKGLVEQEGRQAVSFYTNYESDKGEELLACPRAALTWYWPETYRQLRLVGDVARLSADQSDAYFDTRPEASRAAAIVSAQSRPIASSEELDVELARVLSEGNLQRPPHWGGYALLPQTIEFWQGREQRLHDRLRYTRLGDLWIIERLAP